MAKNAVQLAFIIFLVIAFLVGAYVYATIDLKQMILKLEGMEDRYPPSHDTPPSEEPVCPDLLIQRGKLLYLYNSQIEEKAGENPKVFNNLDEYVNHLEKQKIAGKSCPVLFLQQETNTQGQDVYRVRPSPTNPQPQLPLTSSLLIPPNKKIVNVADASRENGYNTGMYAGFDPYGQYIGKHTDVDLIHESTEKQKISDNPMDLNWGGVLYTQDQVNAGKYVDNQVTRPNYTTPKGGEFIPIPNSGIPQYPGQSLPFEANIATHV
jgi:hypothetical protein